MSRYELYLPLKYNDGTDIEPEKIKAIREELLGIFGGITASSMTAPYQGSWKYGGVEYVDDIIKLEILAFNDETAEEFFRKFKERLKISLNQLDILIVVLPAKTI